MVEEDKHWVVVMPRLLIGLCLLFWAVMSEKLFIGVALTVLIEGYWLVKIKWNFSYANFVKSWYLCVICGIFIALMYWVDGATREDFRKVFEWMPVIFFPIVFAQRYSIKDSMPMNTFFLIARKRMNADIREKRVTQPWMINVTLPYFLIVLLSAGLFDRSNNFYGFFELNTMVFYCYVVATLLGCFIFLMGKRSGRSMGRFIIPYGLMMFAATFLLSKLHQLESVIKGTDMVQEYNPKLDQVITKIGALEEIKNTKKVQWRMWVPDGEKVPSMIPMTIFNIYRNGIWGVIHSEKLNNARRFEAAVPMNLGDDSRQSFTDNSKLVRATKKEGAYRFLSTMSQNSTEVVVPHLKGYFAYGGLVGDEAYIERSKLGSVLIGNPDSTLQCYMWKDQLGNGPVSQLIKSADGIVPDLEKEAIGEVVDKLGLRELSDVKIVEKLQSYFINKFNYTKHLESGDVNQGLNTKRSALSYFLQSSHSGHCEYFATAGTLILREAGINARYINGFVVKKGEKIDDAYALRGDQVHAWTQMWDGAQWLDVDFTPPDWLAEDTGEASISERLSDWWKLIKEDFQVWRSDPENAQKILYGIYATVALLVLWILGRLFFAKNRVAESHDGYGELPSWKALKKFNKWSQKKLGKRQTGMPYATWVKELKHHLPKESDSIIVEYSELYSTMKFAETESNETSLSQLSSLAKRIMHSDKKKQK